MKVLGIHDGHLATACLLHDGRLTACASEERFTRKKNQGGAPRLALHWILTAVTDPSEVDAVAIAGITEPIHSVDDLNRERHRLFSVLSPLLPAPLLSSASLRELYLKWKRRKEDNLKEIAETLKPFGIFPDKFHLVEHHEAHAATAHYLSWYHDPEEPVLIFTLDGSGDGISGTVAKGYRWERERLLTVPVFHSIGMLYTAVTQYLKMKPLEEEYKVMGLAPYAPESEGEKGYRIFQRLMTPSSNGTGFSNRSGAWGERLVRKLEKELAGVRFDGVAFGVQKIFEELILNFIVSWIRKSGIRRVAVSGGCFMNVKLNMKLARCNEIEEIFFFPGCGDESVAIGAAVNLYVEKALAQGDLPCSSPPLQPQPPIPAQPQPPSPSTVYRSPAPIGNLDLGPSFSMEEIEKVLLRYKEKVRYRPLDNIEEETAKLLAQNKMLGRVRGSMEWGARALGNRSILAHPSYLENVGRLNTAIKGRDFWMPFAPSLLMEEAPTYLETGQLMESRQLRKGKGLRAPYMIVAFPATDRARAHLKAALHPADLTCRPQVVEPDLSAEFSLLLRHFHDLTRIGGLLNTSFNLHGAPLVCSPEDALETFLGSSLDTLTLEEYLVEKR